MDWQIGAVELFPHFPPGPADPGPGAQGPVSRRGAVPGLGAGHFPGRRLLVKLQLSSAACEDIGRCGAFLRCVGTAWKFLAVLGECSEEGDGVQKDVVQSSRASEFADTETVREGGKGSEIASERKRASVRERARRERGRETER